MCLKQSYLGTVVTVVSTEVLLLVPAEMDVPHPRIHIYTHTHTESAEHTFIRNEQQRAFGHGGWCSLCGVGQGEPGGGCAHRR